MKRREADVPLPLSDQSPRVALFYRLYNMAHMGGFSVMSFTVMSYSAMSFSAR